MGVVNILRMNPGDDESSYANNSTVQETALLKSRKCLEEAVINLLGTNGFPECLKLVDLGCSSGPNTLLFVNNILNFIHRTCCNNSLKTPEIQVFLNDLPDNDFNTVFKMVPPFYQKLENGEMDKSGKCFISGVPGSFFTRLFPTQSIHFFHSSCGLHFLSQVPKKLEDNKKNIYMSSSSPPSVYEAYFNQYKADLSLFLRLRSEELIPDGRMVLTVLGRSSADHTTKDCCRIWDLLAKSLQDMSAEGLIHEEDINSFNLPVYTACVDEMKAIVQYQGSFNIDGLEYLELNWDLGNDDVEYDFDMDKSGKAVAKRIRAITEPVLANHFGNKNSLMDKLFEKFAMHLATERTKCFFIMISLTRKNV